MSKKSIKQNYIYNTLYQVLSLITPLITAPHLARVLGPEGIGEYSYVSSILSYFMLFACLGMATYAQREIAFYQDDRKQRTRVFWDMKALILITSLIALVVYIPLSLMQENPAMYLILSMSFVALIVDVVWLYQGMEEFGVVVLRNALLKIADVLFIFFFIREKDDLLLYVFGVTALNLLSVLSLGFGLKRYVDKPDWKNIRPFRNISTILALFVPTIAIQVYTVLDKTMIGLITQSAAQNGFYEQAIKLSKIVLMLVTSLGTVMFPRISYYVEKGDTQQVRSYMYRAYRFVWFLGIPLCFGMIAVAPSVVPWFYGPGYDEVIPLIQILSLLILAIGINNVTGMQYLIPTKRQSAFTLTVVIGAVVNFLANLALIYFFQSIGAAIASVLAETVIAVVQIVIVRKELSPWHIVKNSWRYWIAGGIMLAAVVVLNSFLEPTILTTIIQVCVGAVLYFAVLLILRDDFFISNLKSVCGKLLKRA